ncbi:class I SAM-dependent methyltransferase [Cellulomonas fimi]|uniref:Class I SAM-dependent methyltransferase n=1 Tax=Cellulomonas fimi TaxID=1708 RepID=A0A7Y0M0N3_CELFI|nr:class I SAM-dependent methyltransferase [Cellulomonas fimi]NMR21642.1 class I SAM-dependent methyltransferase [Cellulomonas fimi]
MSARQLAWRLCYEALAARSTSAEWSFMNYGFAPLDPGEERVVLQPEDEADRLCLQLYAHVVGGTDLGGTDVLEVGSGRGGGSSYLARYHRPRSVTGVDFSASAIRLSARTRTAPGLRFVRGDALQLPFGAGTFDAVVNVESSHCYASMPAFLAEVRRVLRPGGELLWADLRRAADVPALWAQLAGSGLELVEQRDITAHVLASLRSDNDRKLALIDAWIPRAFHRPFRRFAGIEGTENFRSFERGERAYLSARLVRRDA